MRSSILALLVICYVQGFAQSAANADGIFNLKNVIPPSPNAASLAKYVEWPVNLNTGVANINLPLYELKGRTLSVPVSASYHAGGIKVGELASWAGLGWSIQAGGVITRSVRGLPDECASVGYFSIRNLFPDKNYTYEALGTPTLTWKGTVRETADNQADGVHDSYYLNAMGRSYRLLFKAVGSALEIYTIPHSNLKVTGMPGGTWKVVMEDGTKLIFGESGAVETTNNLRMSSPCGTSVQSAWYLSSITSSTGEQIKFKYAATSSVEMITGFSQDDFLKWESIMDNYVGPGSIHNRLEKQEMSIVHLDSIISETGFVKFKLRADSLRKDLPGARALSSIEAYSKINGTTTLVDKFTFLTKQVRASSGPELPVSGSPDYVHWRLRLDAIQQNGSGSLTNIPQWKFTYNDAQKLPSTLSYAVDHYGYYNGRTSNASLLPYVWVVSPYSFTPTQGYFAGDNFRRSRETYMKAGILTAITYPTGGRSEFNYEANYHTVTQAQQVRTIEPLDISLTNTTSPFVNNKQISFTTDFPQFIRIIFNTNISSQVLEERPSVYCKVEVTGPNLYDGAAISLIRHGSGAESATQYFNLRNPGTYTFKISTNAIADDFISSDHLLSIDASLRYIDTQTSTSTNILTGGLRVTSIVDKSSTDTSKDMARYFEYASPMVLNVVDTTTDYVKRLDENISGIINTKFFRNSSTKFALGSGGSTICYGKVTTKYGSSGQNGKVITTFFNDEDRNESGLPPNEAPYPDLDTKEYARGLLLSEVNYDASGNKLSAAFKTYGFQQIAQLSFFKVIRTKYYQSILVCPDPDGFCVFLAIRETITSEQVKELTSMDVMYSKNGGTYDSVYTLSTYTYETTANTRPTKTVSTDSQGSTLTTYERTALEKSTIAPTGTASVAIDSMLNRNMVGIPLQIVKFRDTTRLSTTLTNYKVFSTGPTVLMPEVLVFRIASNPPEARLAFSKYDSKSNLLEQRKMADIIHSYIYDYNSSYPIAEAINADENSIAYTSFEADGKGKWTFNASRNSASYSYTGLKSFELGSSYSIVRSSLTSSKSYKVSYWAKTGASVQVNSSTITEVLTRGNWKYYETVVTGVTEVTISGTGYIDEVRLHPSTAQMATATYKPSIGKTSETDVGNNTIYYEYDTLNRLVNVRDDRGNLLKSYSYHYKTTPY